MALLGEFFRETPSIPKLPKISVGGMTAETFTDTAKYLPQAEKLASDLTSSTQSQWMKMMGQQFPGWANTMANIGSNMESQSRGEVPQQIQDMLQRNAAVKALGTGGMQGGSFGASMGQNDFARSLGITGLGLMQEADAAARWWGQAGQARMTTTAQMIERGVPSTTERTQLNMAEREAQFQRKYLANVMSAQDSFGSRMAAMEDSVMEML